MTHRPEIDPTSPLLFVINGASGANKAQAKREAIEQAMAAAGRPFELWFCEPHELADKARQAAAQAAATRTAVVAVGGDGTLNTVAQAVHAAGGAMGVVAQGTFNYFARTHHLPTDPGEAVATLLRCTPQPVQLAAVNDRVFLVNASLGLYPDLLEDRETYKARFGRNRWVALGAALATLLGTRRSWRLRIQLDGTVRDVRTMTLFVGNNRLQLAQFGVQPEAPPGGGVPGQGSIAAVMLRSIGTGAMLRLILSGAMGRLGEAESVENFAFHHMTVQPSRLRRRRTKVAFDGEVAWMRAPLDFRVVPEPLYLLKPEGAAPAEAIDIDAETPAR